uniref:TPR repeat/Tetratricopeptide repeat/Activator of Hsp90 ATPase, N-terminal, putative n=1 Tax=Theileria annulata TaxID=5874 RepID=A0A3B0N612_THEAN
MSEKPFESPDESMDENLDAPASLEECLSKASTFKSAGNEFYKLSKFKEASESYNNGITWIKKMNNIEPHKELLSVLYSNLCASYLELFEYGKARESANEAITNNKNNIKAYYRRAQALFNIGSFEEALSDCNHLLEIDKSDPNVNNLLRKINLKLKQANQQQKKAFGGLFDKVGGLYDDRQLEMQNKKQTKYEEYVKTQEGEEKMDYESWEKYEQEQEAKKELERSKKAKEEGSKKVDETPDLDEEDEKIINETKKMGYCYFGKKKDDINTNLQSNHTITPQPVNTNSNLEQSKRSISSWNSQDMTQWCKKTLEHYLLQSHYQNEPKSQDNSQNILQMFNEINLDLDGNGLAKLQKLAGMIYKSSVKPSSVEALEGDAQIAFIRGTRRYLFDFSCNINLDIEIDTDFEKEVKTQLSKYQGVLVLKEISSERESGKTWTDYMSVKYKSNLKPEHQELVKDMLNKFKENVSQKIDQFLTHYQTQ